MTDLPTITAIDNFIKFHVGDILITKLMKLVLNLYDSNKEDLIKRVDGILKLMVDSDMIILKDNLIIKRKWENDFMDHVLCFCF